MSSTGLNRNRISSRTNSYKGLLLVTCRRRVVWFGDYVGEDILVSLLVCIIKGMVPEGGVWKRRRMCVVPGRKRNKLCL